MNDEYLNPQLQPKYIITMGININDNPISWSKFILNGKKTIETRNTNSLKSYIGRPMGIIRTGVGKAHVVGFVIFHEPIVYTTIEEFRADKNKHGVDAGSPYDWCGRKYGYPVEVLKVLNEFEYIPVDSLGIVARKIKPYEIY